MPGTVSKHLRFGIKIFDSDGNVGEYIPPRSRAKIVLSASEGLSYHLIEKSIS